MNLVSLQAQWSMGHAVIHGRQSWFHAASIESIAWERGSMRIHPAFGFGSDFQNGWVRVRWFSTQIFSEQKIHDIHVHNAMQGLRTSSEELNLKVNETVSSQTAVPCLPLTVSPSTTWSWTRCPCWDWRLLWYLLESFGESNKGARVWVNLHIWGDMFTNQSNLLLFLVELLQVLKVFSQNFLLSVWRVIWSLHSVRISLSLGTWLLWKVAFCLRPLAPNAYTSQWSVHCCCHIATHITTNICWTPTEQLLWGYPSSVHFAQQKSCSCDGFLATMYPCSDCTETPVTRSSKSITLEMEVETQAIHKSASGHWANRKAL